MDALLRLEALPAFTFEGSDGSLRLELSRCGGEIQACADHIAAFSAPGEAIGLMFRSGPALVLAWLGTVLAGRVPCVLQVPTAKQGRSYWRSSVTSAMATCGIRRLVHASALEAPCAELPCLRLALDGVPAPVPWRGPFPGEGRILQLSSGTTGHRKGIAFGFEALRRHMEAYAPVLDLGPEDVIASWLPLYHDMGFVACFLMPLVLGIPVVMMDPMDWVGRPAMLFEAIGRHRATTCFLPNFAFEVMAREADAWDLGSMRRWISCSEPVHAATLRRFMAATGAASSTIHACYAMAENVFAVAQSRGLEIVDLDGREAVGCGRPIPGTELRFRDGEIHVRSPHALAAYEGAGPALDAEGFYATGDLGAMVDGTLVVTGRRRDLVNIGGRKLMLSDLDALAAPAFPGSEGRIAALARFDEALGTERVVFLAEHPRFWEDPGEAREILGEATGLEAFEVRRVPPGFITKTSSGKINRVETLAALVRAEAREREGAGGSLPGLEKDLAVHFAHLDPEAPLEGQLDSMGRFILRLACEARGIEPAPGATLSDLLAAVPRPSAAGEGRVFSIVALVDGIKLGIGTPRELPSPAFLDALEAVVGCPVVFEHLAAPPLPVLLSDLIFHAWFLPGREDPSYSAFSACMEKIRNASVLLVDDEDNFRLPQLCVYPQLDHRFARAALADYLGHRFTRYTLKHHLLPCKPVLGLEIQPAAVREALEGLRRWLGKPVLTLAFHEAHREHTADWDYREYRPYRGDPDYVERPIDLEALRAAILAWIRQVEPGCARAPGRGPSRAVDGDPPHFCSFLVNPKAVEWAVNRFRRVCILGLPSSVPILARAMEQLGRPCEFSPTLNPAGGPYDCVFMTGASGMPDTPGPVLDFIHAQEVPGRLRQADPEDIRACPFTMLGTPEVLKNLKDEWVDVLPLGNFFLNGGRFELPGACMRDGWSQA